jgi:hypothetical protein
MFGNTKAVRAGRVALSLAGVPLFSSLGAAQDAALDAVPVWRLQVKVQTCDLEDAGTDDNVYVKFRSVVLAPRFYLNYGRDDFVRGRTQVWDVQPKSVGIAKIGDITEFSITKTGIKGAPQPALARGVDGWCLKTVELLVNGSTTPIFRRVSRQGLWLDGDDGHQPSKRYSLAELRADPRWGLGASGQDPRNGFNRATLISMVEGATGNAIANSDVYWGHRYDDWVEIKRSPTNPQSVAVDLDLAYSTLLWDPDVDVNFDLHFSCSTDPGTGARRLGIALENKKVTVDGGILTPYNFTSWLFFVPAFVDLVWSDVIATGVEDTLKIDPGSFDVPLCPAISVANNGAVTFDWTRAAAVR